METKIIVLHILLGVAFLCVGAPSDGTESSTSTSVSVSTVTRKVTSRSFSRSFQLPNNTQIVTEDMLKIQDAGKSVAEESDAVAKPLKVKKKILASNLKNVSEKVVFPVDKHEKVLLKSVVNVTEVADGGKPNSSDSSEDEVVDDIFAKNESITEIPKNRTSNNEETKKNGGPIEGRSLEDRSSEENVNVNPKAKSKSPPSTTVRTTNAYSYETFGELQKVLNNNYISNNEGYEQRAGAHNARPSPSMILLTKKSPPISRENSLKNAIRFESEYYGPTGQTDWVPIIPDKLPVRSPSSGGQHFGSRLKPSVVEKSNKTNGRNSIVFPSEDVRPMKDKNAIPVREVEIEGTTQRGRGGVQTKVSTSAESVHVNATQAVKHVTKFRGGMRYKSPQSNASSDDKKFQNETAPKKNISLEIPVTGASWTLATLKGSGKSTVKPLREETTEISVVSSTNHTTKSQNAVDSGLAVPPESVKMENVTKEPQMKNIISGTTLEDSKHNKSEILNSLPKVIDGSQGWIPIKVEKEGEYKNDTDLVIPGSVVTNRRNESGGESVKPSMPEIETTSATVTTEEETVTESIPEVTTFSKPLNSTTESPVASDISSQTEGEQFMKVPVTIAHANDERINATEESVTVSLAKAPNTLRPDDVVPIRLKSVSTNLDSGDTETSTEVQSTTLSNLVQNYNKTKMEYSGGMSTERTEDANVGETDATVPSPVPTAHTTFSTNGEVLTTPKYTPEENVTKTVISVEITNPKPKQIKTTTVTPITVGTSLSTKPSIPSTSPPTSTSTTISTATTPAGVSPVVSTTTAETTSARNDESKAEVTEEGIYYKNYLPTTVNPHAEITEENVPAYLRLTVQAKDWKELCSLKEDLREAIIKMLGGKNVSAESVHFLNLNERNCQEKIEETKADGHNGTVFLPVNMFLMDRTGNFDKNLSEAFLTLWGRRGLDFELPIRKVDFVTPIVNLTELAEPPLGGSVVAAIVISCVAGICVILLGVLFVIMKRRQKRFNYGQRCTPVSLDAYSLDSVSIYNSVRRKGVRASKRSYGNAAFDDPEVPTHPMNFAGLANFSSDKEQLYEEFNIIPQVYPKVEELPAGAETKNRYANIIPLPETRVHLSVKDGDAFSDYINANYIRGLKGADKLYIACQAPMESTIEDFWRMVWEQQCKVILMLTDLQENGIEKCADYLPPNEVTDNLRLFGDFQVTLKKRDVKEKYIISNLKLKNMEANLWREVTHLWYLGWPDQGVPSEANSLIAFLIEARSQMKIQNGATTTSPVVVHCSPGTGRTGTVIACDLCIREYEQSRMVDIPRCVFNLRRDRAGAVQTKDQYAFIYQVLNVYATKLSGGGIESI